MKAVMPCVPPEIVALRRQSGADQWDEVWDGVLHMPPNPNVDHQDLEGALEAWLRRHWAPGSGGRVLHQINVARAGHWPRDYRVPDLVLLTPARFAINRNEYFDGGPEVVVEIQSPHDETWEKMSFYSEVGVREAWVIDRDTKRPRIVELGDGGRGEIEAGEDGWVASAFSRVELRAEDDGRLGIRLAGDAASEEALPERR